MGLNLLVDPGVGSLHAFLKREGGTPIKLFLDYSIVRVSATDTEGTWDVLNVQLFTGDIHGHFRKLVD